MREIIARGEGAARAQRRRVPVFALQRAVPERARLPAAELDRDRGLCGRAVARHAARRARPHQGARRRLRAAGDGLARRHDLDRRRRAGDARWCRARSAASSARGWLADRIGPANVLCTDIGGTSFDIALMTDRRFEVTPTPDIGALPAQHAARADRLGRRRAPARSSASTPTRNRPEIGPDSAGRDDRRRAGPRAASRPSSITDLNLVLGRLNPDYFLGGEVKLDVERARARGQAPDRRPARSRRRRRRPGIDRAVRAASLRNEAVGRILGKGYSPGRLHAAVLRRRRPAARRRLHRGRALPARCWCRHGRPGFSAFGCACADFEYRFDQTVDLPLLPRRPTPERAQACGHVLTQCLAGAGGSA